MKIIRITYDCEKCGIGCSTTTHNLKYRTNYKNALICQKCLIKLEKSKAVFAAIPPHLHYQIFNQHIEYDVAYSYLIGVSTKFLVRFICKICNQVHHNRWSDMGRRKHHKYDNICLACLNVAIQNRPDKILENRNRTKGLWGNNEYKMRCLKAFEAHNTKMQHDSNYALKHRRKSKSITGNVTINDQVIEFDSAFELIFLWSTRGLYQKIRRCDFSIAYDGHFYHPDFFVIDLNNYRTIIEIKGYYQNNVEQKQKAAENYIQETNIADEYALLTTKRLISDGILRGIGGGVMWKQIREICDETVVSFTNPKHQQIAEIGISRYRRKIKNQKNI